MLSRLGNLAKTRAQAMKAMGGGSCSITDVYTPIPQWAPARHAWGQPAGAQLQFSADVNEMHRAYLEDESIHLTVPMKTIYRIIALGGTDCIHVDLVHKVEAWKDTVFFTHTIPGTAWPILYTPASMQLLMWPDDEDRPDLAKMLITVVAGWLAGNRLFIQKRRRG